MKQAISLGIKDGIILEEIGDLFESEGLFHDAAESYRICHNVDPQNGSVMQKLGSIYCNEENPNLDKDAAIECLKIAIDLVKGENNKQNLAYTL